MARKRRSLSALLKSKVALAAVKKLEKGHTRTGPNALLLPQGTE